VHLSDISWNMSGEEAIRGFKKGDELEAVVLSVDPERERISLGIKQLDKDPFASFVADREKGVSVKGVVREVDAKGAIIDLGDGVEGQLRASELSREHVEDARTALKAGDTIEAKFMGVDRKNRIITLSVKALDADQEAQTLQNYKSGNSNNIPEGGATTLGDLLKAQMEGKSE
jgi:small subunit ribosomal protein S1